eukprot:1881408-Pyramimonas_sp.AAC.1
MPSIAKSACPKISANRVASTGPPWPFTAPSRTRARAMSTAASGSPTPTIPIMEQMEVMAL